LFYLNDYGCLVTKNGIGLIDPCSEEEFLSLDETGWQLYEPQPTYAVGDWIEYFDNAELCHAQIDEIDSDYCTINPVAGWDGTLQRIRITCITRKLDPSEVVVHIGCLSGTVVAAKNSDFFWLSNINNPLLCATIPFAMLDPATAALVLELLEKQVEA
jgi:hypothetical protein